MADAPLPSFDAPGLIERLEALDEAALDSLAFGVIGIDAREIVCRYNAYESRSAALSPHTVIGKPLFTEVAQCMNNYLVAELLRDARALGVALDATIDFVLTWRMRPQPVKLRMLAAPGVERQYVLLQRGTTGS